MAADNDDITMDLTIVYRCATQEAYLAVLNQANATVAEQPLMQIVADNAQRVITMSLSAVPVDERGVVK